MNCTKMLKYENIGFTAYIRLAVKSLLYHLTVMQGRYVVLPENVVNVVIEPSSNFITFKQCEF